MVGVGGAMTFPAGLVQEPFNLSQWFDDNPDVELATRIVALLLLCLITAFVTRKARLSLLRPMIEKSRFKWDDVFLDASFFRWLSYVLVALVAYTGVGPIVGLGEGDTGYGTVRNISQSLLAVFGMLTVGGLLDAVNTLYSRRTLARTRPIKGYIQIAKIFLYLVGTVVAVALLVDRDPTTFLVGLGGMTAVLLLIFKDTILGLVASVQLTNQDMVRVGDWIEMPSAGADGDVLDIALHTVKVQNFDKTICTIPTHKMITDSFKNWRGMQASGGRRIKRNINLDMSTIRFLNDDDVRRFGEFALLKDYIAEKKEDLNKDRAPSDGKAVLANARQLTNIGTFRAYTVSYLRSHPMIHLGMTFLVRQLQPTENGLPLEIYIFTRTTNWNEYEDIQADIFDHLLAVLPEFGLRVFQRPTGGDFSQLASGMAPVAAASDGSAVPPASPAAYAPGTKAGKAPKKAR